MFKNQAGQKVAAFAFDATTGIGKTGDASNITLYVSKDFGAVTQLADTTATEKDATNDKGTYVFDLAQAETNADDLRFSGKSSTPNIQVVPFSISTLPANFTAMSIDSTGNVKIQTGFKRNQALVKFGFTMTEGTNRTLVTGKTVQVTRSIDGGSFSAGTLSAVTEIGNGTYAVDFAPADMNGAVVMLRAAAAGCNDRIITFITEP